MSLFVILFTLVFRKRVVGALGVFILLEGLVYGFGFWWLNYLYVWPLLALLTYLFRWMTKSWQWAVFSGLYGLAFGTFCSLAYLPIGGIPDDDLLDYGGFPFDIAHAVRKFYPGISALSQAAAAAGKAGPWTSSAGQFSALGEKTQPACMEIFH